MKKITKRVITTLLLTIALVWFYIINGLNYNKHIQIKRSFVEHPENLPTKEAALNSSLWYKNLKSDIYRLEAIQYIWWNALWSEYKKYLFVMLDLITELNPYFDHPYIIGQLLLPSYNERYENLPKEEQEKNINQSVTLWMKWIKNFCDPNKIELIKNEENLQKIWTEEKYKNPCRDYNIPNYLAYIYYYYKHDPESAATYYKVASAVDDSPAWAKIMAAIMSWKWWNREKSYFMFLNIAKFIQTDDKECLQYASNLEQAWAEIFMKKWVELNWAVIQNIANSRVKIFGEFKPEKEQEVLSDTKCENYVNKAIRELNLEYVERAEAKYFKDKAKHSLSAKVLYDEKYLDFLPVDFQQYKDYWIIYYYNTDIQNYDYKMWTYWELDI